MSPCHARSVASIETAAIAHEPMSQTGIFIAAEFLKARNASSNCERLGCTMAKGQKSRTFEIRGTLGQAIAELLQRTWGIEHALAPRAEWAAQEETDIRRVTNRAPINRLTARSIGHGHGPLGTTSASVKIRTSS